MRAREPLSPDRTIGSTACRPLRSIHPFGGHCLCLTRRPTTRFRDTLAEIPSRRRSRRTDSMATPPNPRRTRSSPVQLVFRTASAHHLWLKVGTRAPRRCVWVTVSGSRDRGSPAELTTPFDRPLRRFEAGPLNAPPMARLRPTIRAGCGAALPAASPSPATPAKDILSYILGISTQLIRHKTI